MMRADRRPEFIYLKDIDEDAKDMLIVPVKRYELNRASVRDQC
jgi:hypothetical protein